MKWIACMLLALCLQSSISLPPAKNVRMEENSLYFKKGVYSDFLNDQLTRLREVQIAYPEIVFQLTLYQLESEPRGLTAKRYKTVIRRFQEAGLDMNRIVFDSEAFYVKDFAKHNLSLSPSVLDSVGAILEGKVLSLD